MPDLRFTKMHGCGNDFVVIDAVRQTMPDDFPATWIANRRLGVGCDQVLILRRPPKRSRADFGYQIINADGSEVGQCGNGARCAHAFLRRNNLAPRKRMTLATSGAQIMTEDAGQKAVRAYLATPKFAPEKVPIQRKKEQPLYAASAAEGGMSLPGRFSAVSLGNPHAVFIATEDDNLEEAGRTLNESRKLFPEGVNVGFCRREKDGIILRVYERGVGETPSCGSGAAAAAVVMIRGGAVNNPVKVTTPGGVLSCGWKGEGHPAWIQGRINFVFDGILQL